MIESHINLRSFFLDQSQPIPKYTCNRLMNRQLNHGHQDTAVRPAQHKPHAQLLQNQLSLGCAVQESEADGAADTSTDNGSVSSREGGGTESGAVQPRAAEAGRAPGC